MESSISYNVLQTCRSLVNCRKRTKTAKSVPSKTGKSKSASVKCRKTLRKKQRRSFHRRRNPTSTRTHRSLPSLTRSTLSSAPETLSISVATQTGQILGQESQNLLSQLTNDNSEKLFTDPLRCNVEDAISFSDAKICQLSEELQATRNSWLQEKSKLIKRLSSLSNTSNELRVANKRLMADIEDKNKTIRDLSSNLLKSEAARAGRSVAIKCLKDELSNMRKNLSEMSASTDRLRKQNESLILDNRRYEQIVAKFHRRLHLLRESTVEWERVISSYVEILSAEGQAKHVDCKLEMSYMLGNLKASYDHRIQWLLTKLFRADKKTEELYRTIEKILKGLHFKISCETLKCLNVDPKGQTFERPAEAYEAVLGLSEYMAACHWLAFQKHFSSNLSELVVNVMGDMEELNGNVPLSLNN